MSLQIADNFSYKGKKPLDARLVCNDIPDMLALPTSTIYDGIIVYVVAKKKFYTYDSNNTVDPTLQKWRELTTAGILIQSATIDNVTTSATKGHLILTMSDGTTIDFNQCDVEGTTITCTAENVSPDRYSVSSLTSDAEGEQLT